jgi:hypothetical protein
MELGFRAGSYAPSLAALAKPVDNRGQGFSVQI